MTSPSKKGGSHKLPRKKTRKEFERSLQQLEGQLNNLLETRDKAIKLVASSVETLWSNQKELTKSQNLLDEQFAVSTRMAIMGINLLLEKIGAEERLDGDDVEQLFKDWATFRTRPDFRNLMMEWMLGVPLDKLPAPPEAKKGDIDAESDTGDADAEEGRSESGPPGEADDVPEVQPDDGAKD